MTEDTFDELMDLLDRPKRYSNYIVSMCCFHEGYRPNLFIYEDTYHCASCERWGTTRSLLDYLTGNSTVIYTQEPFNFRNPFTRWMKDKSLLKVLRSAKNNLKYNLSLRSYLLKRGLDHSIINKLN